MSQPLLDPAQARPARGEAPGRQRYRPPSARAKRSSQRARYRWEGDTLNFAASAMWQRITGRIEVLDDVVRVEIDLPWIMQLLRDTIAKRVRGRGVELLERPPGEA